MPAHRATAPAPAAQPGRALKALWYDGLSSRGRRVLVMIEPAAGGPQLVIEPLDAAGDGLCLAHRQVQWPQTYGRGTAQNRLTVALGEHGTLEVQSAAQWHEAYNRAGGKRKVAERLQLGWKLLLGFTAASVLLLVLLFRYGTPMVATQLARFVPIGWELEISQQALAQLDGKVFRPSSLPAARQLALRQRFEAMLADIPEPLRRYRSYQPMWRLEFRASELIGANALAFPGGVMVLTDGMVALADKHKLGDDALLGVLAHEIGHIVHRHSSRALIEQTVLNAVLSMALSDVSGWVALASTSLTTLAYSRAHEREADCFSMALMRHQKMDTRPLAKLFAAVTETPMPTSQGQGQAGRKSGAAWDWLSTHPDSGMRIADFQSGQAMQCDLRTGRLR
ncbi:M48 family metallopeptidase [Vandammella animalimorsus]|uniref:Peptidase M48 n=1 Tax=Vandammella animalimorsus TaxID=2029117 RepID=A0A2A2AZ83_9BURK|nr:M48 family metallopeptidase [Vandammella animalimorsus]PAT43895.1 peptidase M48 [Vandammella animalimorsus]